jgi:hypothetical protein
MANILVRHDQFNITPEGIIHKPTDAAFIPYPGDPHSGITRLGQLGNNHPNGNGFSSADVQRVMSELWGKYVVDNPQLFKAGDTKSAETEHHRQSDISTPSAEGDHVQRVASVETK